MDNGFKVGPNYNRPVALVEQEWIDYGSDPRLLTMQPNDASWWQVFDDPQLNQLVWTASEQNLTLRTAGTRILQAQAVRGIAAGNLFPQIQQAFGSYDRVQVSSNIANSAPIKNFSQWDTGFNLSWELDFWGRFRRSLESADAALDATIEGYDNVLVLLVSDVAATYVEIRTLQEQLRLLRENARLQQESLAIADAQFEAGAADEADVLQLRNNVNQTESLIPVLEAALRQANNALCILLGEPPRDLIAELGSGPIPTVPAEVAVGVSRGIASPSPRCSRSGTTGGSPICRKSALPKPICIQPWASTACWPGKPIRSATSFHPAASPDRSDLVFLGTSSTTDGSETLCDCKTQSSSKPSTNTKTPCSKAQRETEDSIVGFLKSQQQYDKLQQAVRDVVELDKLLLIQAEAGAANFNRVFVVQTTLTVQQNDLATSQAAIAQNLIRIYRSLGGGWQVRLQAGAPAFGPAAVEALMAEPGLIEDELPLPPTVAPQET